MSFLTGCSALAPAFACRHADLLLYLAPSAALAILIRALARAHPFFFLFTVAGTICHELAHFCVGLVTGARPGSLTVIPRRVATAAGSHWELGSVTLNRVRWYNAAPAALAPLLIILLPFAVAHFRTAPGWRFQPADGLIAFALAPQFLSCWPSSIDWRIAARSWPYLLVAGAALLFHYQPGLFQFVKP